MQESLQSEYTIQYTEYLASKFAKTKTKVEGKNIAIRSYDVTNKKFISEIQYTYSVSNKKNVLKKRIFKEIGEFE